MRGLPCHLLFGDIIGDNAHRQIEEHLGRPCPGSVEGSPGHCPMVDDRFTTTLLVNGDVVTRADGTVPLDLA